MISWKKKYYTSSTLIIVFMLLTCCSLIKCEANDDFDETLVEDEHDDLGRDKYIAPEYQVPKIDRSSVYFLEMFDDKGTIGKKWLKSESKKEAAEGIAKYDGLWSIDEPSNIILKNDKGLIVRTKARHHAISAKLDRVFTFDGTPLVVQYEVKYEEGQECGGGYIKLLRTDVADNLREFNDKSPYVIMFGPDKCGMTSKIHLIIRHKNPKDGTIKEYHAKQPTKNLNNYFEDKKTHLYTLVIKPDNSYQVSVDNVEIMAGNLLEDLEPSVKPDKQIPDPDEKKPSDWDDREMIEDTSATKPDDWDESQPKEVEDLEAGKPVDWLEHEEPLVSDPEAVKPKDWDDDMDGEWEARKIPNPKCEGHSGCGEWKRPLKTNPLYKGKWTPPKIKNPNYKGNWTPRSIDNPNYFDADPYKQLEPISAIGIELWTMSSGIVFDNFVVTNDLKVAKQLAMQTFEVKTQQEKIFQTTAGDYKGILKSISEFTEDKPWIWALLLLVILVPVILIYVFCFGRKSSISSEHKKTDEPTEDDAVEDEMETMDKEDTDAQVVEEGGAEEFESGDGEHPSTSGSSSQHPSPERRKSKDSIANELEGNVDVGSVQQQGESPRPRRVRARRQD